MKSQSAVNDRIRKEIANLKVDKNIVNFLLELVEYELDVMDKERPQYTDQYKMILENNYPK
jgi:hypothetical protein